MKPETTGFLFRICLILALIHWAHMPYWGGVLMFLCFQINVGLFNVGLLLLTLTLSEPDDAPTLHAVPDHDESA